MRAAGCSGPMAARLAILKAARQLAVEAGVYVHVRKFSVINEVRTSSNPKPRFLERRRAPL